MARLELVSPLTLAECQRLLTLALQQSTDVDGSINGTKLAARKRISYRNSFQTRLSASLVDENGNTRIRCRFSMHPFVIAFLIVWLGFVLLAGGGGIIGGLGELASGSPDAAPHLIASLIPGLMLLFGGILVLVGRLLALSEQRHLMNFVRETLKASPSP